MATRYVCSSKSLALILLLTGCVPPSIVSSVEESPITEVERVADAEPVVAIQAPSDGSYISLVNDSAGFQVSGICTAEQGEVVLQLGGTAAGPAVVCVNGIWSLTLDSTLLPEGTHDFTARITSKGRTAASPIVRVTRDVTRPVVNGLVNDGAPTRSKAWTWSCSKADCLYRFVVDTSSNTLPGGAFSATSSFTQPTGNGPFYIHVQAQDSVGNVSPVVHASVELDNSGPASPSILIAGGAAHTNSAVVNLSLSAADAVAEMYITNAAGCGSGGAWEPYAAGKNGWILGQANGTATVYVKLRDTLGNESGCVSDSIVHDDQAPVLAFGSPAANTAAVSGLTVSGTCEAGLSVDISGDVSGPASTTCTAGGFNVAVTFTAGDGVKALTVSQTDAAGNTGSATRNFSKDATGPTAPSLSIAAGAVSTATTTVALSLSAAGAPAEMYISNTAGCASGGVWETYATSKSGWTLAQNSGTAMVYVRFRDALGNESSCASDEITVNTYTGPIDSGTNGWSFTKSSFAVSGGNPLPAGVDLMLTSPQVTVVAEKIVDLAAGPLSITAQYDYERTPGAAYVEVWIDGVKKFDQAFSAAYLEPETFNYTVTPADAGIRLVKIVVFSSDADTFTAAASLDAISIPVNTPEPLVVWTHAGAQVQSINAVTQYSAEVTFGSSGRFFYDFGLTANQAGNGPDDFAAVELFNGSSWINLRRESVSGYSSGTASYAVQSGWKLRVSANGDARSYAAVSNLMVAQLPPAGALNCAEMPGQLTPSGGVAPYFWESKSGPNAYGPTLGHSMNSSGVITYADCANDVVFTVRDSSGASCSVTVLGIWNNC